MMDGPLLNAATSRAESGEKSMVVIVQDSDSCEKTCSSVFASHTNMLPSRVLAACHLPSLDTTRSGVSSASNDVMRSSSRTRHTRTALSSLLRRYSLFTENVTARSQRWTSISMDGEPFGSIVSAQFNKTSSQQHSPTIVGDGAPENLSTQGYWAVRVKE